MPMTTKVDLDRGRLRHLDDVTDLAEILFPGNRNQQHAAARILLELKGRSEPVESLAQLQERFDISRRTLQRTRARLSRLGLIERVTWMNTRYGGRPGWRLSGRMARSLRQLADRIDDWRCDARTDRRAKESVLAECLRP